MPVTNIETAFPLSPLQQGMLFHSLGAPGTAVYVLQLRGELRGPLDVRAFGRAWQRVLDRHQALRAAFVWEGVDEPMQVIGRRVRMPFHYQDWRGLPARAQRRRLDAWTRRDRDMGFTLSRAPLMRVSLVRLDDDRHEVVWTHHHLISDGWSEPVLLAEVWRCYEAFAAGRDVFLPDAPRYGDYIARLPRSLDRAETFWRAQVGDVAQPTPIGIEGAPERHVARAGVGYGGYGRAALGLPEADSTAIELWARHQGLSLGTLITAAWAVVLSRYSRLSDIVFGVTVSGRSAPLDDIESLVGLCINTLPLRMRVPASADVLPWLRALQDRAAELREHEHTPLARLHQWTSLPPGTPLFETIVVFENFPVDAAMETPRGAGVRQLDVAHVQGFDKTNYALTLVAAPGREFVVTATYDPARFDADAVPRLLGHVACALRGLTIGGKATLADVSLLSAVEREEIVAAWNATDRAWPDAGRESLVAWLDAQAARTPDAEAVWAPKAEAAGVTEAGAAWTDGDSERWTYAALHAHANRIARRLQRLGVAPESRVGVWMTRSPLYVAALLGTLKAGAAYVPLDPAYPAARLAFQIADAQVAVVLTEQACASAVPAGSYAIDVLDADEAAWRLETPELVAPAIRPRQLAYVIYTSGSTGRPKGAMNDHRGLINRLRWMQDAYRLTPADRVLHKTSCSFDVSAWELFWPLGAGAALVLAKTGGQQDPVYIADLIARAGVTVTHFVPAMLEAFAAAGGLASCARLRLLVCSGEALPAPLVARCQRVWPGRLENLYGPTEAAIDVSFHACDRANAQADGVIPIGRPVANTQLYVVDRAGQPAPAGVAGELCIGGVQVGRGYWQRPDLTAERFLPDPFGTIPGARLYRTGDLARARADGVLAYIGRVDHQVKLRGNRIEPGEIEAALREQHDVRDAAVLLREDDPGSPRLVAYLVLAPAADAAPEVAHEVRTEARQDALRARLPEYMVPSVFVLLDALPLTPNGKVDRRQLPAPDGARPSLARGFVPPRTDGERALAAVWAEVLRLDRVGVHDNFFALGGDSMRVLQVQARAREQRIDLSIEQLMRYQTIDELARLIPVSTPAGSIQPESIQSEPARSGPAQSDASIVSQPFDLIAAADRGRLPADAEDAYPLTELQAGMLFHSELDRESAVYHDVQSFHLRMRCDIAALRAALADLMEAHPILRTSVHLTGYSVPLQIVRRTCEPPLHVHDLPPGTERDHDALLAEWVNAERRARFTWTSPPLFRVHLHRRADDSVQCTLCCHHAILDGWSVATFFSGLVKTYMGRLTSADAPIVPAPIVSAPIIPAPRATFRNAVARERAAAESAASREYWMQHLGDAPPTMIPREDARLRQDERGQHERRRVDLHAALLPVSVADGLRRVAADARVPIKSVLLAGHLRVLALVAGETDVVTGVVTHGRTGEVDGDRVLGVFLNTTPFRCNAVRGSWIDLARRVFAIESGHAPHRHFPMALLRRLTQRQQLYDAAFNLINFHVYQALRGTGFVEVLGGRSVAETEIPLLTQCTLNDGAGEIEIRLEADTTQFTADRIAHLLDAYVRAYEAMADNPGAACADAPLLSPAEREQVLVSWNATAVPHRLDCAIHEQFALQARQTPDALAVVDARERLTYAQLARRASRVAAVLQRAGVGPDTRVGLCAPRDAQTLAGLLGTLQAGGAYVPLDPAYPDERLSFIASDAAIRVLLTAQALAPRFADLAASIVCLDDPAMDASADAATPFEAPPAVRVDPDHLIYVMYTSGSTGKPKGIGLPHRCMTNLIAWHQATLRRGARTLQFASLGFDASLHEMAAAWCSGGTLYLVAEDERADSWALARYLHAHGIEKAILPVVVLQQLAEHCAAKPDLLASLREIITTGEQLRITKPIVDLMDALPFCALHNHYGPAETHVVTAHALAADASTWPAHPLIGRPIDNTTLYVLDRRRQPAPVGTPGELFIGGVGVARGYDNRADLTAERFVPDQFGADPGGRCYRTGDLVRWSADGELEFLGRIDHQVKIRGYRIELGEVEATLNRSPDVRSAFVVARAYAPGDTRLVAYVVPAEGAAFSSVDLRARLARSLPDYMIPAAFVRLDEFPLTRNGKIDTARLPAPEDAASGHVERAGRPPRTSAERIVVGVYRPLLQVADFGVDESFFDRGGHSLLATQAVIRLREIFGFEIPLRALFEHPTVEGLVEALGDMLGDAATIEEIASTVLEVDSLSDADVDARLAADADPLAGSPLGGPPPLAQITS